ncbi:MAG: 30S ribosome-binding factor RbfA [Deltaproteobacteria bacterium]|nr:30S ribosome-binding factor RbfA [Deltaproteobacteria bacterium]
MTYKRSDRIADVIKEEISTMLVMAEIKDPRIGFVTITKVALSDDLRSAKVFFSVMGTEEERENSRLGLQSASGYIRHALIKRLKLKRTPEIIFKYDDSIEYSSHINEILKGLKSSEQ